MIKLQPGYHCNDCPCFDGERYACNILDSEVKCDYHDGHTPAMPLFECPVDRIVLTEAAGYNLRQPQIMGIFNEDEYDQWLDQGGDDDN